jgi:hypothetical protein
LALEDATTRAFGVNAVRVRDDARNWLTRGSRDFIEVCDLAGVEADRIQSTAKRLIADAIAHEGHCKAPTKGHLKLIEFKGRSQSITEWARETGINYGTLVSRLNKGWPLDRALTERTHPTHPHKHRGVGSVLSQNASDRSTPITRDCV